MRTSIVLTLVLMQFALSLTAQQQEKSMVSYTHYLLYIPKSTPVSGSYPLILFLHGSDERGKDLSILKKHGPPSFLDDKSDFPFVVVSPQCPADKNWDKLSYDTRSMQNDNCREELSPQRRRGTKKNTEDLLSAFSVPLGLCG